MEDVLKLPVTYQEREYEFPFRVLTLGYSRRYVFLIDGIEITYEQDDQGELRALAQNPDAAGAKLPERELLEAIGTTLQQIV